jgi:exodeoxyribonuclease VII small subunit
MDTDKKQLAPIKFEDALTELETVVQDLERGDITLDQSLARYERGIALLKDCFSQLKTAEAKIRELTGVDNEGKPVLEKFEESPEPSTRRKRKTE